MNEVRKYQAVDVHGDDWGPFWVKSTDYDALRAERDGLLSARDDLGASNRRLRETLEVAIRHIDMAALRISHPKDAALIERMGG